MGKTLFSGIAVSVDSVTFNWDLDEKIVFRISLDDHV